MGHRHLEFLRPRGILVRVLRLLLEVVMKKVIATRDLPEHKSLRWRSSSGKLVQMTETAEGGK